MSEGKQWKERETHIALPFCSVRPLTDWMMLTHTRVVSLTQCTDANAISSDEYPFTDTPRKNVLSVPWAFLIPVKLTHKIYNYGILSDPLSPFFGITGVWTQGLTLASHVPYHLSHASTTFCFNYFSNRVLGFLLGSSPDHNPPTSASLVAGITDYAASHQTFWLR
jgi:hypothetical protein